MSDFAEMSDPLARLQAHVESPQLRADRLTEIGGWLQNEIDAAHGIPATDYESLPQIDTESWQSAVDDGQPTLALRGDVQESGRGLLGAASQRLRADGESICNIVFLPDVVFSDEGKAGANYYARAGMILPPDNAVRIGTFVEPLQIDAIQGLGMPESLHTNTSLRFVNEPKHENLLGNKSEMHNVLQGRGIRQAEVLADGLEPDSEALHTLVSTAYQDNKAFVIKPVEGSLGRGVMMVDPSVSPETEIHAQISQAGDSDSKVLVEEWLRSMPLRHAETQVQQDWNIRAIIVGGDLAGAYVRVGAYGGPVNIATAARPATLRTTLTQCGLGNRDIAKVEKQLEKLGKQIYEQVPANIMGLDVILTDDMELPLVEVNGENAGGLYKTMTLERQETDWDTAIGAVRSLNRRLFTRRGGTKRNLQNTPLVKPSVPADDIIWAATIFGERPTSIHQPDPVYDLLQELHAAPGNSSEVHTSSDRYIKLIEWQRDPTPETSSLYHKFEPRMAVETFSLHYDNGQFDEAFAEIERYADAHAANIDVQIRCAKAVLKKSFKNNTVQDDIFEPAISAVAAASRARAQLYMGLAMADIDPSALSQSTRRNLLQRLQSVQLGVDPGSIILPLDQVDMTDHERAYLLPAARYLNGRYAAAKGDADGLQNILCDGIRHRTQSDIDLAGEVYKLAVEANIETSLKTGNLVYSLAQLMQDRLALAVSYIKTPEQIEAFSIAFKDYVSNELAACVGEVSEDQIGDIGHVLLRAAIATLHADLDAAEEHLKTFTTLTEHYTTPPFEKALTDINNFMGVMKWSIEIEEEGQR